MATLKARGNSWVLNWHDHTGQHRLTIGQVDKMGKREAERILKAKEHELASQTSVLGLPSGRAASVRSAIEAYALYHGARFPRSSEKAIQLLLHDFTSHLDQPLSTVTPEWLDKWVIASAKTRKTSTIHNRHAQLKAFLRWASENGFTVSAKAVKHKGPRSTEDKFPVFFSADELQRLYAANPSRAPLWRLMANTGMRRGEVVRFRPEHIIGEYIYVQSSSADSTKTGKKRAIPISPGAREALSALVDGESIKRTAWFIPGTVIGTDKPSTVTAWFRRDAKAAGINGHLHCLRHTFASTLAMQGISLAAIQKLLGHSTLDMTMVYAHLSKEHIIDSVSNLTI